MRIGISFILAFMFMSWLFSSSHPAAERPVVARAVLFDLPADTKLVLVERTNTSVRFFFRPRRAAEPVERYSIAAHDGKTSVNESRTSETVTAGPILTSLTKTDTLGVDEHRSINTF